MADMPIPGKIATKEELAKLPEPLRAEYVEREGAWYPNVTNVGGYGLGNIDNLTSALSTEREAAKAAHGRLKAFEGIEPEAARSALGKVAEMSTWSSEKKVAEQIEQVKAQLVGKHGEERKGLEARISKLEGQLHEELVMSRASAALLKAGVEPDGVALLLPHVTRAAKMLEEDGRFVVRVFGPDGKTPLLTKRQDSTAPMVLDEYVELMKGDPIYARGFPGTKASGSGSPSRSGASGSSSTVVEISEADARDTAKYARARKEATEKGLPLVIR